MKKVYLLLLTVMVPLAFYGQNEDYIYGRPGSKYLKMESYDKDPEAEALIVYERGESVINWDKNDRMAIFYTYKARIKIFNKNGFDRATFEIPLHKSTDGNSFERITDVRATSYNVDAPPIAIGKDDVLKEKVNEYYDLAKFTIPKVKEGTLFDVEYTVVSPFLFYFPNWKFQSDIPKLYSEYFTKIPANYRYNAKIVGTLKFDDEKSDIERKCITGSGTSTADCAVSTYVMKDIPAFKKEDYMTSTENYISQIKYELRETESFTGVKTKYSKEWKDVDHEFKTMDIGKQARKEGAFEKLLPTDIVAMPHDIEKAKAIYYMLQKNMVWNGKIEVLSNEVDVKKAWDEKKGSLTELNLILLNMLKASGFNAYFVLLREREDGFPTLLYPVITEFNYVVIKLVFEDKIYYLDITEDYLPFGLLPKKALNYYGRVFDFENESYWDNILMGSLSAQNTFLQYGISSEGAVSLKISDKTNGFFAVSKRKKLNSLKEEAYLKSIEDDLSNDSNANVVDYRKFNAEDVEKILMENFTVEFEDTLDGGQLFLNPLEGWLPTENPFKLSERNYPVDFGYPFAQNLKVLIKADSSYEYSHLPETVSYEYKNLIKLEMKVYSQDSDLTLEVNFIVYKSIFDPEEYQEVKDMFSKLVNISKTDIILKKKV